MMMTDEKKQAYTVRITQANPTQLCVILYEILLDYLTEARAAYCKGDRETFRSALDKSRGAVSQLLGSVNSGQPISETLRELYAFSLREIAKADAGNRVEPLEGVEKCMQQLRDAYAQISTMDARGQVMANAQTVYAGLTYGRNSLNENLADQGNSRGFRV